MSRTHSLSIVIPVYRGSATLETVVAELGFMRDIQISAGGARFQLQEVLLVDDRGPDNSADTIRRLAEQFDWVVPVWLTRNFGQHAATLAGMASTRADWIVTIDEDAQHDPRTIGALLDCALDQNSQVVYGVPASAPPHGFVRNFFSRVTKKFVSAVLTGGEVKNFSSFRLVVGGLGRSLAAYTTSNVYLDVALSWVAQDVGYCRVNTRQELRSTSGYSQRALMSHFFRLVLSAGTRPLRLAALLGVVASVAGVIFALAIAVLRVANGLAVTGWASLFSLVLVVGGLILLILGILAEYLGVVVRTSLGRPIYLIGDDPVLGPQYDRPRK